MLTDSEELAATPRDRDADGGIRPVLTTKQKRLEYFNPRGFNTENWSLSRRRGWEAITDGETTHKLTTAGNQGHP